MRSLIVEQLVSSNSEESLAALSTLAEAEDEKLQEFFAGEIKTISLLCPLTPHSRRG